MPKIKLENMSMMTNVIGTYAADLGMIPKGAHLEYVSGVLSREVPSRVDVVFYHEDGYRTVMPESFLPTFTYKTTRAQQYRELTATYKVLTAMVRVKHAEHGMPDIEVHPSIG